MDRLSGCPAPERSRLFRCRHLDRGQSRSTTLKDCGRAGMRAHQRPRRRRAPGLRGLTTERRRVDPPLFGESRQPSDKQTWLKRHLRIEHLAGRVQQGLLDSTELAVHALHITPSSGVGPELSRAALICRRNSDPWTASRRSGNVVHRRLPNGFEAACCCQASVVSCDHRGTHARKPRRSAAVTARQRPAELPQA
jgi:hypothetical protein